MRQREAGYVASTADVAGTFDQIAYVSPSGRELARVVEGHVVAPAPLTSAAAQVVRVARRRGIAMGPAYAVRGKSVPGAFGHPGGPILRSTMAVTETRPTRGVLVGEVNLSFVSLLLASLTPPGSRVVHYMIDGRGQLVARSDAPEDASLRDLSGLPEVRTALQQGEGPRPRTQQAVQGRDVAGRPVLATSAPLPLQGWYLLALQPDPGTRGPLTPAIIRIAISLLVFLALAVVASLVLARRMTRPILAIQRGAGRIGEGSLDERIELRTGDELESLADEFNRMAERLSESTRPWSSACEDRTRTSSRRSTARAREHREDALPRQHVPRAAHAPERDHQLRRRAARRLRRRAHLPAGGLRRGHPRRRAATFWS